MTWGMRQDNIPEGALTDVKKSNAVATSASPSQIKDDYIPGDPVVTEETLNQETLVMRSSKMPCVAPTFVSHFRIRERCLRGEAGINSQTAHQRPPRMSPVPIAVTVLAWL